MNIILTLMLVRKFLTTSNLDGRFHLQSFSNISPKDMTGIRIFLLFIQSVISIYSLSLIIETY